MLSALGFSVRAAWCHSSAELMRNRARKNPHTTAIRACTVSARSIVIRKALMTNLANQRP